MTGAQRTMRMTRGRAARRIRSMARRTRYAQGSVVRGQQCMIAWVVGSWELCLDFFSLAPWSHNESVRSFPTLAMWSDKDQCP